MNHNPNDISARPDSAPLIELAGVSKTFGPANEPIHVLDDISLSVRPGEIVALLGRSGSGKSTLLRCVAGLIPPTTGEVRYRGEPLTGTNPGTAMVFQSFALLPWLTVRQNVELGLEAQRVPPAERRVRAEWAIDLIGLDGFEDAYPKELSGGMRQRVGFARALVVGPDVLLMDEPFSALDVLTAENLRGELLELWAGDDFPIQSIVLVTHNLEEAMLFADRVLVLGSHPGRVVAELAVDLPRPRDRDTTEFQRLLTAIYAAMTGRADTATPASTDAPALATPGTSPLPNAGVDALSGFAEILAGTGSTTVAALTSDLTLERRDLVELVDALALLGFAAITAEGTVALTTAGKAFADADIQGSKQLFAGAALDRAPLVHFIANALDKAKRRTLPRAFFVDVLRRFFGDAETDRQLDIAIDWGRYAEQFAYDADHDEFVADPDRLTGLMGGAP